VWQELYPNKHGAIAANTPPTLKRLGITLKYWLYLNCNFESRFKRLAGFSGNGTPSLCSANTLATCKKAECFGVTIRTDAEVKDVLIDGGRTTGVQLSSRETVTASKVIANVGHKLLYSQMIDEQHLEPGFQRRVCGFRASSGTFRMNVALFELPDFTCRP